MSRDGNLCPRKLVLKTEGVLELSPLVYINGKNYKTEKENFSVKFSLDYKELITPNILVTIKWGQKNVDLNEVRLISVCIF